uniref:Gag1-like clamp domain-containing protein n=1 Tax=Araucaria cunninghamii TaxID=56994 RepID=A0A0D6R6F0_ARACU
MHGSSGCLGGCGKPTPIIAVNEPSKRLKVQGQSVRGPSFSEDFWSTSANEMDNGTAQSQKSLSSTSGSNPNADQGASSNMNNTEFVNHAFIMWNEVRRQWTGNRPRNQPRQLREPVLSWTTTYESLLGNHRPFPQVVPLSEMVEFLVDIWEQEGMYND